MASSAVVAAVQRLARRDATRTEADAQADIYQLLTSGDLRLATGDVVRLEQQTEDGTRRRLDIEVGHCVIEVKKDIRNPAIKQDAEKQLLGYVTTQSAKLKVRYVGVLTDGTVWNLYRLEEDSLQQVASLSLDERAPDAERLLIWLESIMATQERVNPVPVEIDRRLGALSPAHLLDHASLMSMYRSSQSIPRVAIKRDLWAKLLRTAFGTAFVDDESLFIDHTLLVLTAEIIAHAVVGFDISDTTSLTPQALVRGGEFANAQIYNVVEADFFDWVLDVPGGQDFVSDLCERIARFDWSKVEHDVLKTLYESVIASEARASLGEYYTPDWLANRMVDTTILKPLDCRVLDPACGSGTFLFHACRAYLAAAEESNVSNGDAVLGLTRHVVGMDVHPVAVTLARVTYLLAIGRDRLAESDRGPIGLPVYLGDALQWEHRPDLLTQENTVTVATTGSDLVDGSGALFGDDLVFPTAMLRDADQFDRLISEFADRAIQNSALDSRSLIAPTLRRFGVHVDDVEILSATFDRMRALHATGRDHIWGYYVRNLVRPIWLGDEANRVDVLVGNPPWLRYSKMTAAMQARYKSLAKDRGLLSGGLGASGRDLSTLFVARAVELYLKPGGSFAFVMPHGTLTRRPHHGFRTGRWGHTLVRFGISWDLSTITTGFPMTSCVIHGEFGVAAGPMPAATSKWTGRWRKPTDISWDVASTRITISSGLVSVLDAGGVAAPVSPYKRRFRQGAVLAPRALLFVELAPINPLGAGAGRLSVQSRRTTSEKKPWINVPSMHGTIEKRFVHKVYLGESIAPYRLLEPLSAVLPLDLGSILSAQQIEDEPALSTWWNTAETAWRSNKSSSDKSALLDRIDFHGQLGAQLSIARHRVVYTASGNTLVCARLESADAIVEHKLYWGAVSGIAEARFLTAILNSTVLLDRVRPLQAIGLFGARDFDKNVFSILIPTYKGADPAHKTLVALAKEAEKVAAKVKLNSSWGFKRVRREVQAALEADGVGSEIEAAVAHVLPEPPKEGL